MLLNCDYDKGNTNIVNPGGVDVGKRQLLLDAMLLMSIGLG